MDDILKPLRSFFKTNKPDIDNFVFRLHYQWTILFLLVFFIILTVPQYFGNHVISCNAGTSKDLVEAQKNKYVDNFCWTTGTFSVADAWRKEVGTKTEDGLIPYPGIDTATSKSQLVYHWYYQWVNFVLFFQCGFFYMPRLIWKSLEKRRMLRLSVNFVTDVMLPEDKRQDYFKSIVRYLERNKGKHRLYFWSLVFAECLNFANVVLQMFLLDGLFGGKFISYGLDVLRHDDWSKSGFIYNPMLERFPRLTKCTYFSYGFSGTQTKYDFLCLLTLNILNEKIFLFLWFWFCGLMTLSSAVIVYRLVLVVVPQSRLMVISVLAPHARKCYLRVLVDKSDIGDWFFMSMLAQNVDGLDFRDIVDEYVKTSLDQNANRE